MPDKKPSSLTPTAGGPTPVKEKSHKRSQFRGKLTLPGKKAERPDKPDRSDKTNPEKTHMDSERNHSPRKDSVSLKGGKASST